MVSSVPIHTRSCGNLGCSWGPSRDCQLQGRVAGLLNYRTGRAHRNPRGGELRTDTGTQAHHLSPVPSPRYTLQGPERGLYSEKEYEVFCLFSFKINGSASGLLEGGRGASRPFCAVVTAPSPL